MNLFVRPEVLSIISILVDTICPLEPGLVMSLFERPEVLSTISSLVDTICPLGT